MSETTIVAVLAWEAFDSRGRPTVACRVQLAGGGQGRAVVPSGASTGSHEARELRDGGTRYDGYGVQRAVGHVREVLAPLIIGRDAADRPAVDAAMEDADGTPLLARVGANAVLAVSLAVTLAHAAGTGQPLYRALGREPLMPMPMVNIVSGGAHAARALDVQDVLAVPVGAGSFAEAIEWVWRVRRAAARLLDDRGGSSALVADEGGLAGDLPTNEAALALVAESIDAAGLSPGSDVGIAVDLAATQLLGPDGRYHLPREGRTLDTEEWLDELAGWCRRHPVVSLEDVLGEDDWAGWRTATKQLAHAGQVLGDDLFVTDTGRLARGVAEGVANAVLVKPNQAGTVTRAENVVTQALAAGYAPVVSARSGDTEDHWLADLAVGWRAGQIKVGSTHRSERTAKWNRLLEIEAETAGAILFAGRTALAGRATDATTG